MRMQTIGRVAPAVTTLACLLAAWAAWYYYSVNYLHPLDLEPDQAAEVAQPGVVTLTAEKLSAARIVTQTVQLRTEERTVVVPGRLAYDPAQSVVVRLGASGVLIEVSVLPGQSVMAGQILATMSSPEIGSARADQLQRAAELDLAKRQFAWDQTRANQARRLIDAINAQAGAEELQNSFSEQAIGQVRESLLSAYSEVKLAKAMTQQLESAASSGALSARTVEQRRMQLASSQAALQATIEQTLFDVDRAAQAARIGLDDAARRYELAAGRVTTLLGLAGSALASDSLTSTAYPKPDDEGAVEKLSSREDLSLIEIRAPRSGTVEKRYFNANERVDAGVALLEIADTSRLWLKADIRESQWSALGLEAGQIIRCSSPALPDEVLEATVVMMGREVDPHTNALPLVATVENRHGRLRPGLFVRTQLPMGVATSALLVPESAVAVHEGRPFVFVTTDGQSFTRRDVRLGQPTATTANAKDEVSNKQPKAKSVEVTSGLAPGEKIAVSGVFYLKSELLLEREE